MNQLSILIGKKLKSKRLEFGYSQGKIGAMLGGLTFQQIQKYEEGSNNLSLSELLDLCKLFDIGLNYFIEDNLEDNTKGIDFKLLGLFKRIKDQKVKESLIVLLNSIINE